MAETAAHISEFRVTMKREGFTGSGLAPVPVIGNENLIPVRIHVDSMRIGQRRIRALDNPQRVVVSIRFSRIHADAVGMFRGDVDLVMLDIERDSTGSMRHMDLSRRSRIAFRGQREDIDVLPVAADRKHLLEFRGNSHSARKR